MPIQSTDTTTPIAFTAEVQTWVVEANVTVAVSGAAGSAVISDYDYSTLLNHGNLSAASAVYLFGNFGLFVNATDGSVIAANNGVESYGFLTEIVNHGDIDGRRIGVMLAGESNQLSNDGNIYGGEQGAVLGTTGGDSCTMPDR